MIDKNDIPKEYHYVVIAWYDKVATSGLDANLMAKFEESLFAYLRSINVSEENIVRNKRKYYNYEQATEISL